MISIKSAREIELMREAGRIVALCHLKISEFIKPGVTTLEIDALIESIILENGGTLTIKGYQGFPACVCTSVNEEVVHGIPNKRKLVDGDIISVDIVASYKGYVGDSAWTYPVGNVSEEAERLLKETQNALWVGLDKVKAGIHLSDVSHAIETHAQLHKLGIVREFAGHGLGTDLHEEPEILNYGKPGKGPLLKPGMVLAIEPMLNLGKDAIKFHNDGWKTTTIDKKYSAHFEHTIVVTESGYDILTKL